MERVLRRSVEYAFENRDSSLEFVKSHAQEIQTDVIDAHIALYVNSYSVSLTEEGRQAIRLLFTKTGITTDNIFL